MKETIAVTILNQQLENNQRVSDDLMMESRYLALSLSLPLSTVHSHTKFQRKCCTDNVREVANGLTSESEKTDDTVSA